MAEGMLRVMSDGHIQAYSAGTRPKGLNPISVQVMKEIGIDISGQTSKDVSEYQNQQFDLVITVCDSARESCPVFPGSRTLHWSIEDPEDLSSFRETRAEISRRIDELLKTELSLST